MDNIVKLLDAYNRKSRAYGVGEIKGIDTVDRLDLYRQMQEARAAVLAAWDEGNGCLSDIYGLTIGYDGYATVESLQGLVDEIGALARSRKPLPMEEPPKDGGTG